MTTTVTVINVGDLEVHKIGCRDILKKRQSFHYNCEWQVPVPDGSQILRACQVDLADSGFASDEGMTPEEWVDAGHAHDFQIFPCVHRS